MPTISSVGPVAVDLVGGIAGDGTTCHPLAVNVDGSTVKIDANDKLVAQVVLSTTTNPGLNGDGSPANPLSVAVDGNTLTITNNLITAHALTDPQSGLNGDGTSSTPLEINVDGTTTKIINNKLVAVSAPVTAGVALGGAGTPASPLNVLIDGNTVIINGNNQLALLKVPPHGSSHQLGANDPVFVTGLAGFPGGITDFLRADGTFATPTGGPTGLIPHHSSHEFGQSDQIQNVAWLNQNNTFVRDQTINGKLIISDQIVGLTNMIDVPYNQNHFRSGTGGAWSVPQASAITYCYSTFKKVMTVFFHLLNTGYISTGGNNMLTIDVPGGASAAKIIATTAYLRENNIGIPLLCYVVNGGVVVTLSKFDLSNFVDSSIDQISGQITFEIF